MDDVIATRPAPKTPVEYKAAIAELLAEIDRINEQMASDRAEIERLKAETALIKADTEIIKARSQMRLDALQGVK